VSNNPQMYRDVYCRMNFQLLVRLQSGFIRYMSHSFGVNWGQYTLTKLRLFCSLVCDSQEDSRTLMLALHYFDPHAVTKIYAVTLFAILLLHNSVVFVKPFLWKHSFYNGHSSKSFPRTFNYNLLVRDTLKMEAARVSEAAG